jgi:hypothetical protein
MSLATIYNLYLSLSEQIESLLIVIFMDDFGKEIHMKGVT